MKSEITYRDWKLDQNRILWWCNIDHLRRRIRTGHGHQAGWGFYRCLESIEFRLPGKTTERKNLLHQWRSPIEKCCPAFNSVIPIAIFIIIFLFNCLNINSRPYSNYNFLNFDNLEMIFIKFLWTNSDHEFKLDIIFTKLDRIIFINHWI